MTTTDKFRRVTRRDAHEAVAAKQNFKYNESAHGEWTSGTIWTSQWNSDDEKKEIAAHVAPALESYVVYSYDTPIAIWNRHNGWWTTTRYFTRTTSTHQGFVRRAGVLDD